MSYRLCWLLASGIRMFHPDPASTQSAKPVWHIPIAVYTVLDPWWWAENLSETWRVLFQNKFEKLVHLIGFIIRIYNDARSSECQIKLALFHANNNVYYIPIMSTGSYAIIKPPTTKLCSSMIAVYSSACRLTALQYSSVMVKTFSYTILRHCRFHFPDQ